MKFLRNKWVMMALLLIVGAFMYKTVLGFLAKTKVKMFVDAAEKAGVEVDKG